MVVIVRIFYSFFVCSFGAHRDLHSFPTRRSSDLRPTAFVRCPAWWGAPAGTAVFPRRSSRPSPRRRRNHERGLDRKSTRLNSSHSQTSYAVFCLKKKQYLDRLSVEAVTVLPEKHR